MSRALQLVGRWGETAAASYLVSLGYEMIDCNARTPHGEIDLVARSPDGSLVFIEVKTRRSASLGPPEISVTPQKLAHLLLAAEAYCLAHPELAADWRIDVLAVSLVPGRSDPMIVHFENAVTAG